MAEKRRVTVQLDPVPGTVDRWSTALSTWPGFQIIEVKPVANGGTLSFTQNNGEIVCSLETRSKGLLAQVEVDDPAVSVEAARLELDRAKAKTEDLWRGRTLWFSIGSAILTAVVSVTLALIARPAKPNVRIDVDAVHSCRDSLQRLSTLSRLPNETVVDLSSAIGSHVNTCDAVLEGLIVSAAKSNNK